MDATLSILDAAGAQLAYDEIEIGEKVYLAGNTAGISPEAWDTIRRNKVFLKAPITTPQGVGYKSLNVSTRKFLGLYAYIRPCFSLHPYVSKKHPKMDLVIILHLTTYREALLFDNGKISSAVRGQQVEISS